MSNLHLHWWRLIIFTPLAIIWFIYFTKLIQQELQIENNRNKAIDKAIENLKTKINKTVENKLKEMKDNLK
jgi:hypothetical protein